MSITEIRYHGKKAELEMSYLHRHPGARGPTKVKTFFIEDKHKLFPLESLSSLLFLPHDKHKFHSTEKCLAIGQPTGFSITGAEDTRGIIGATKRGRVHALLSADGERTFKAKLSL